MVNFESMVNKLPWSADTIIGQGIGYFIKHQDPENVELQIGKNGYAIKIRTDEQNVKEAVEFWEEHVEPNLTGEQ